MKPIAAGGRVAGVTLLLATGCSANVTTEGAGRSPPVVAATELRTRVFDVVSLEGLSLDGDASGLGLGIELPREVSATPAFQLTVSVRASDGQRSPFELTLASELDHLERPSTLTIPQRLLPAALGASEGESGGLTLVTTSPSGVRRLLPPTALTRTGEELIVTTSQPMGQWSLVPESDLEEEVSRALDIETSGLAADESLRYEVRFDAPLVEGGTFDVQLPDESLKQKTTGDDRRQIVAPAAAATSFSITVLEAPVDKICSATPASGRLEASQAVALVCRPRT